MSTASSSACQAASAPPLRTRRLWQLGVLQRQLHRSGYNETAAPRRQPRSTLSRSDDHSINLAPGPTPPGRPGPATMTASIDSLTPGWSREILRRRGPEGLWWDHACHACGSLALGSRGQPRGSLTATPACSGHAVQVNASHRIFVAEYRGRGERTRCRATFRRLVHPRSLRLHHRRQSRLLRRLGGADLPPHPARHLSAHRACGPFQPDAPAHGARRAWPTSPLPPTHQDLDQNKAETPRQLVAPLLDRFLDARAPGPRRPPLEGVNAFRAARKAKTQPQAERAKDLAAALQEPIRGEILGAVSRPGSCRRHQALSGGEW